MVIKMKTFIARPFVKWAGGKTQLLPEIEKSLPSTFPNGRWDTYVEPFVGGGAVLFWILQKFPSIKRAIINDINPELITTYKIIKAEPNGLIAQLRNIQKEYIQLSRDERLQYYLSKREKFNSSELSDIETAAIFIFLNRTCFNGLYRVNAKGEFNVPHGRYANPRICDEENIMAASTLLQKTDILCGDFAQTAEFISPNTLFYLDPPYKPISKTSNFNAYTQKQFDDKEQIRLRDFCQVLTTANTAFILSNSDVFSADNQNDFFDRLYRQFDIRRVLATRMVNSNPERRGKLSELLITNINQINMKRDFNDWLSHFIPSIADYQYYTNFNKVFSNVDAIKIELNILNSLIGSKSIEDDFRNIIAEYPKVLKCIPILIAKREMEILATDHEGSFCYNFSSMNHTVEQYIKFMRKTGLFNLLENHLVHSLVDYVTGVETGLDSNGRKNRGGHLMEDIVEQHLQRAGFKRDETYFKEIYRHDIEKRWKIDLSAISNDGQVEKRFDFVVKTPSTIYAIETNFYSGGGSKLNETARSYKTIALESKNIAGFKFVWFTDGIGWHSARNNLKETFDVLDDIYNIHDLNNDIIKTIIK